MIKSTTNNAVSDVEGKIDLQVEDADAQGYLNSPREIQNRFELLRDLDDDEIRKLNKSVVKKIDWRLMPTITIMFLMKYASGSRRFGLTDCVSYLDRINVSNARLAGMQEDLHMSDTVWNTGISTFYIGYLIGQLPGNLILAKTNPRWFLPTIMLGWSASTICTPAVSNGVGFCVCRFFTGLLEAPFFPGITLSKYHHEPTVGQI